MAQVKNQKSSKKKSNARTRFYVVDTVERTRRRVGDTLENYRNTYIVGPIKRGKGRVSALRQSPRKTLSAWLEEGKEMIADLNTETRSTVGDVLKDGKTFITNARKAPRQTLDGVWDDGKAWVGDVRDDTRNRMTELKVDTRAVIKGISKDAQLVVDEVVASSRQALNKVPGKQKIEKGIRSRMRTLPAQLNLPSKKDIDGLARRVSTLNKKVDALQRTVNA
jgi:polyhydroxyalkanoate synthesis regulator phasin